MLISERGFSTTVNGIERIESQSIPGIGMLKIYFQPGTDIGARHCANLGADEHDPAHRAARDDAADHHPVQRLERPGRAAHALERDAPRAADLRLRPELHPGEALHHPGPLDAGAVRRQAAADQRRHRPAPARRQGPVALRRGQRAQQRERHPAGRDGPHRQPRVQRPHELEPRRGGGVRQHPGQDRRRRRPCCWATWPGSPTPSPTRPTSCGSTAAGRPTWRSSSTPTPRRWRWSTPCATCCRRSRRPRPTGSI